MPQRRILSLWFPRLGAERLLRAEPFWADAPFAIAAETGNTQTLSSLSAAAEAAGLRRGQPLRDAQAMCPALVTRARDPRGEAAFLAALRRWAGRFSPWVAEEPPDSLVIDLTGCAHLFGGEVALTRQIAQECIDLGLSVQTGIADTLGGAWALARYAGRESGSPRSGDAIDQEAPATRSRAAKRRHWERGGTAPQATTVPDGPDATLPRIAPPGQTRTALAPLPLAALRLDPEMVAELSRLGLRRVSELAGQPRAALARRFGRPLLRRLDQAMGVDPEPVAPAAAPVSFAVRLTLPDPIGLESDLLAAIDRLLPALCAKLKAHGLGARRIRLDCQRADGGRQEAEIGLARPGQDPDSIRPLLAIRLDRIDAGFGIDMIRLEALVTEPLSARQHRGHLDAAADTHAQLAAPPHAMADLIGRLGARIGPEAVTRCHPANSHIPEKGALTLAAAWSDPAPGPWPAPPVARPLLLWPPEPVHAPALPRLPGRFRWRQRDFTPVAVTGPERIAPEWWLDDPAWRSGVRDYWRVTCASGDRLWLYFAHGGSMSPGWFCQGSFA
ncbi:DNA polymerase Y family protein [Mesobaculum littorinae]|uniref:DNA-directed DNA polymerase n=1 Tax=Mesobaculum littorinae TaxID=2486419 RepID=A0A438AGE6_9RHOB|nr:DNA polymerase Y family protein [Mesobaculum littorinae]RVV97781.1 DNA polymerase Y family protein [Mesobaculum littorinae]